MRIVGRLVSVERPVTDFVLDHGDDPVRALARRGFGLLRPIQARLSGGEIELVVQVQPIEPCDDRAADTDADTRGGDTEEGPAVRESGIPAEAIPVVRQRIAAYALVTSSRGLLATEFSDRTSAEGRWGLAGGGVDEGEEPSEAVLREVVEETSQQVGLDDLIGVNSSRWIGPNPHGIIEDFHAVRLIYRAHCTEPTDPIVLDVGGTTAAARWIALDSWSELDWSPDWRRLVAGLLP